MYYREPSLRDGETLNNSIWGRTLKLGDAILSTVDKTIACNALTLWFLVIQDCTMGTRFERSYTTANQLRWVDQLCDDLLSLHKQSKDLLAVIRSYDPNMGPCSFRAYKAWLNNECVGPLFEFLRPLLYDLYGGSPGSFLRLNNILQFMGRLTLHNVEGLEEDLIKQYLDAEDCMKSWEYRESLTDVLNYIVKSWLSDMPVDNMHPYFSNGATAETLRGAGVTQKVRKGKKTLSLMRAEAECSFSSPYFSNGISFDLPVAEWRSVPKGIDRRRGISMEPTANQYFQSGLFRRFDEWFVTHPEIGIDLHDQDKSRELALQGSRGYNYATADLSNASDTVTWTLVKKLFRDVKCLEYMDLVRTTHANVDGKLVQLEKYAPMGSVLCFPIECIVFAACASYACYLAGIPQNYRVYGDDIVIDCRAYTYLCDILTDLHFEVNLEKSYSYSCFTEACGIECYRGADVTPIRLSRKYDIVKAFMMSPQQLDSLIDLANRLYEYGLFKTRRVLVQQILAIYSLVPFSEDPETGIFHPCPTNAHLKAKWDPDTQSLHYQHYSNVSKVSRGRADIRYVRTLEAIENRTSIDTPDLRVDMRCGSTRSTLRKKWTSSYAFSRFK